MSAELSLDNPNDEQFFEDGKAPKITHQDNHSLTFGFKFKSESDANANSNGAKVGVTIKLTKSKTGDDFGLKRFNIRCNTKPQAPKSSEYKLH
ncbi:MAG: hypothetical protein P1P64_02155 [Treponemataceae bacterium]